MEEEASEGALSSEEESLSTSSDEECALRRKDKRVRKYYRPEDDEGDLSDSLEGSLEKSVEDVEGSDMPSKKDSKRRKRQAAAEAVGPAQPYDHEEAALQHALAVSMRDTRGRDNTFSNNGEAGPSHRVWQGYDADEAALQQALAASLAEIDDPGSSSKGASPDPNEPARTVRQQEPGGLSNAFKELGPRKGKHQPSIKQSRAAFPAPDVAIVQQAFEMLDPTGAGIINPNALKGVANKLLPKELDDSQIDDMMDFAENVTHGEAGSGVIDAMAFQRLVDKFSAQGKG